MNPVRLITLLSFLLPAFSASGGAADNGALPERFFPELDQILREAMNQSPGMVLRNLDLEIARGDEMAAKSGLYPHAGGSVTYEKSRESREGIASAYNATIVTYGFSISQPVWHWKSVSNNARMGEIRRKIAERQYQDGFRLLAQQIRGSYLDLIVCKATAGQAKFNQQMADDALRLAQERLAKGATSGGEVFQVDMTAQQTRLATDRADEGLHQALISFRRLTGQIGFGASQIPDEIPVIHGGEDTPARLLAGFLSQKEPQNNDTIILRQQLETESLNLDVQRKRLYPMLDFVTGVSQNRQNYSIAAGSPMYSVEDRYVGINLSWSMFDGLATKGAIMSSLARKRQLEARYRDLTQNLAEDAQRQAKLTELAGRQMRISDRLFEDRSGFLRSREDDFKRGTASEVDLNNARVSYNQAQMAAYYARAAYLQQMGDFLGFIMEDPVLQGVRTDRHE